MKHIRENPRYTEASAELTKLSIVSGKLQARQHEVDALIRANATETYDESQLEAAHAFAETGKVRGPANIPQELAEESALIKQQLAAVTKAMDAQRKTLDLIVGEVSSEVCRETVEKHKKLAARCVAALEELSAVQLEETVLIRDMEQQGYSVSFRQYVAWPDIGTLPMRGESRIWQRHRELVAYVGK